MNMNMSMNKSQLSNWPRQLGMRNKDRRKGRLKNSRKKLHQDRFIVLPYNIITLIDRIVRALDQYAPSNSSRTWTLYLELIRALEQFAPSNNSSQISFFRVQCKTCPRIVRAPVPCTLNQFAPSISSRPRIIRAHGPSTLNQFARELFGLLG